MPNWKKIFTTKDTKLIREETVRVLDHEAIHGVIMHVLYKDRVNGEMDLEWPLYHGFDKEYTKEYKEHKHKGRLFG